MIKIEEERISVIKKEMYIPLSLYSLALRLHDDRVSFCIHFHVSVERGDAVTMRC